MTRHHIPEQRRLQFQRCCQRLHTRRLGEILLVWSAPVQGAVSAAYERDSESSYLIKAGNSYFCRPVVVGTEGNVFPSMQIADVTSLIWQHVSASEGHFQASSVR